MWGNRGNRGNCVLLVVTRRCLVFVGEKNFFSPEGTKFASLAEGGGYRGYPGYPTCFFYLFSILKCKCFISEIEWIFKIRDRAASGLGTTLCGMKKK